MVDSNFRVLLVRESMKFFILRLPFIDDGVVDSDSEKIFRSFIGLFLSPINSPGFLMFLECTCVRFQDCVSSFGFFFQKNSVFILRFLHSFFKFFLIRYIVYFVYVGYVQDRILFVFK